MQNNALDRASAHSTSNQRSGTNTSSLLVPATHCNHALHLRPLRGGFFLLARHGCWSIEVVDGSFLNFYVLLMIEQSFALAAAAFARPLLGDLARSALAKDPRGTKKAHFGYSLPSDRIRRHCFLMPRVASFLNQLMTPAPPPARISPPARQQQQRRRRRPPPRLKRQTAVRIGKATMSCFPIFHEQLGPR